MSLMLESLVLDSSADSVLPYSRSSEGSSLKRELDSLEGFACGQNVAQARSSRSSEGFSLKRERFELFSSFLGL